MDLDRWKSQMLKGAAELAALASLAKAERYGLEILADLSDYAGLDISEGSVYPLLNRLQKEGKVTSQWRHPQGTAHPRKYYRLTREGRRFLARMSQTWLDFASRMDALLREKGLVEEER